MKYAFIINPKAGKKSINQALVPQIERHFAHRKLDYEILLTEYPKHATELAKQVAQRGEPVRICACGGDGTLNEIVMGVIGHDNVEICFYPAGSGNDFIKCFGTYEDFSNLDTVIDGTAVPVDVIQANDRYCINVLCIGIDADVANGIPKFRRLPLCGGQMAYNLSLVQCLLRPIGKEMKIQIGEQNWNEKFTLMMVGNGKIYGGGYMAAPEAKPDDGLLDIVLVKKISRLRIAPLIAKYKKGVHMRDGDVIEELRDCMYYRRANKLVIQGEKEFAVNIDGETAMMQRVDVSTVKHAVRFVIPNTKNS